MMICTYMFFKYWKFNFTFNLCCSKNIVYSSGDFLPLKFSRFPALEKFAIRQNKFGPPMRGCSSSTGCVYEDSSLTLRKLLVYERFKSSGALGSERPCRIKSTSPEYAVTQKIAIIIMIMSTNDMFSPRIRTVSMTNITYLYCVRYCTITFAILN